MPNDRTTSFDADMSKRIHTRDRTCLTEGDNESGDCWPSLICNAWKYRRIWKRNLISTRKFTNAWLSNKSIVRIGMKMTTCVYGLKITLKYLPSNGGTPATPQCLWRCYSYTEYFFRTFIFAILRKGTSWSSIRSIFYFSLSNHSDTYFFYQFFHEIVKWGNSGHYKNVCKRITFDANFEFTQDVDSFALISMIVITCLLLFPPPPSPT
jgi:hypothetical protein